MQGAKGNRRIHEKVPAGDEVVLDTSEKRHRAQVHTHTANQRKHAEIKNNKRDEFKSEKDKPRPSDYRSLESLGIWMFQSSSLLLFMVNIFKCHSKKKELIR